MIINPQFFNYKLIIASLIFGLGALAVVSFNVYDSGQAQQRFLGQEKQLVESELSQLIASYDHLQTHHTLLSEQLAMVQLTNKSAIEDLSVMKSDMSVLSRIKSQLTYLKSKNFSLLKTVDSLHRQTEYLERENLLAFKELNRHQKTDPSLSPTNLFLNDTHESRSLLTANSFTAKAYKAGINAGSTTQANRANQIEVCFTLAENTFIEKGMKDIYIQILNPSNNVIADKGSVTFGKFLLFYSDKQQINYNNQNLDVCTTVQAKENDQPFPKGTYSVSVFHKERKLGDTQIQLN